MHLKDLVKNSGGKEENKDGHKRKGKLTASLVLLLFLSVMVFQITSCGPSTIGDWCNKGIEDMLGYRFLGGEAKGLEGQGLQVKITYDSSILLVKKTDTEIVTVNAQGPFTMQKKIKAGRDYSATIIQNPKNPEQECYMAEGARGTVDKDWGNNLKIKIKCDEVNGDLPELSQYAAKVIKKVLLNSVRSSSTADFKSIYSVRNKYKKSLIRGEEIFTEIKDIISNAKHEVQICFYVWGLSDPSRVIGDGIRAAAANMPEGEKLLVRIIINNFIYKQLMNIYEMFRTGNILDVDQRKQAFNTSAQDVFRSMVDWNLDPNKVDLQISVYNALGPGNLHSKIVVVDGNKAVVTGANVEGEGFQDFNEGAWTDFGASFEGPVAYSLSTIIDTMWDNKGKHQTCYYLDKENDVVNCTGTDYPKPVRDWYKVPKGEGMIPMMVLSRQPTNIINFINHSTNNNAFSGVFDYAKKSLYFMTPNVNDKTFFSGVINALKRDVKVIVIASKESNEDIMARLGDSFRNEVVFRNLRKKICKEDPAYARNLELRWYSRKGTNPTMSHTKLTIADEQIVIVGSSNQTYFSWKTSQETDVLIDSAEVAKGLVDGLWGESLANSILVENNCS